MRFKYLKPISIFCIFALLLSVQPISARPITAVHTLTPQQTVKPAAKNIASRTVRRNVREKVSMYTHGVATVPTIAALQRTGILKQLLENGTLTFGNMHPSLAYTIPRLKGESDLPKINQGPMHAAMTALAKMGWITREGRTASSDMRFVLTEKGKVAIQLLNNLSWVEDFVETATQMNAYLRGEIEKPVFNWTNFHREQSLHADVQHKDRELVKSVREELQTYLDGLIAGVLIEEFEDAGVFNSFDIEQKRSTASWENIRMQHLTFNVPVEKGKEEFTHYRDFKRKAPFDGAVDFLTQLGFLTKNEDGLTLTNTGKQLSGYKQEGRELKGLARAFGVPVSYLHTMKHIYDILFGDYRIIWRRGLDKREVHVDRRKNVLGSGFSHEGYFRHTDKIIQELFSRPIDQQPNIILDVGAGDGTFLKRVYEVIRETGRDLKKHPITLVGADINRAALEEIEKTLTKEGIPEGVGGFVVIRADINDPATLAEDLKQYDIELEMEKTLLIRSMLTHNRPFVEPQDRMATERVRKRFREEGREPIAAYIDEDGEPIPEHVLFQNQVEFWQKWAPYMRFGLIDIDLHTVHESIISASKPTTNFDLGYYLTHAYSAQYIVNYEMYLETMKEAGLTIDSAYENIQPNRDGITTISINRIIGEKSNRKLVRTQEGKPLQLTSYENVHRFSADVNSESGDVFLLVGNWPGSGRLGGMRGQILKVDEEGIIVSESDQYDFGMIKDLRMQVIGDEIIVEQIWGTSVFSSETLEQVERGSQKRITEDFEVYNKIAETEYEFIYLLTARGNGQEQFYLVRKLKTESPSKENKSRYLTELFSDEIKEADVIGSKPVVRLSLLEEEIYSEPIQGAESMNDVGSLYFSAKREFIYWHQTDGAILEIGVETGAPVVRTIEENEIMRIDDLEAVELSLTGPSNLEKASFRISSPREGDDRYLRIDLTKKLKPRRHIVFEVVTYVRLDNNPEPLLKSA